MTDQRFMVLALAVSITSLMVTRLAAAFGQGNLCTTSYGTDCCPGWRRDSANMCTVPVCDGDCGSEGQCVGPNLCYCPDGIVQYSCVGKLRGGAAPAAPSCPSPCQNGGRCRDGRCECQPGFSGTACQFASCPGFCTGRGRCLPTGACSCDPGFSGSACDVVDKGPCYSGLGSESGSCSVRLTTAYISREECCNSFGKAWGTGCVPCGRSGGGSGGGGCGFGRISQGRSCVILDFCGIQGICNGGVCLPDGSSDITCLCPDGLTYNRAEHRCEKQQSFCDSHLGVCGVGGSCVGGIGSDADYRCQCFPGYELRSDGKNCTERAPDPCSGHPGPCGPHGTCVSGSGGGFRCLCDAGYEAEATGAATSVCRRRTYCSVNPTACSPGGVCVPSSDGELFQCRCRAGYRATNTGLDCVPETLTTATPGDVCSRQRTCPPRVGDCLPLIGDEFVCACHSGYRQVSSVACELAPQADAPQGAGSAATTTKPPAPARLYCDTRASTCANGRCVSLSETDFRCECDTGYRQADDRRSCLLDRKELELNPCQVFDICRNGACLNLGSGAFQCLCYRGFELTMDRQNCQPSAPPAPTAAPRPRPPRTTRATPKAPAARADGFAPPLDPFQRLFHKSYCQKFPYVCGRGHCLDLDGSHQFTCACYSGYKLSHDKRHCLKADLRESGYCAERPGACNGMGHCVNSPGTQLFQCFCYPGFRNSDATRRACEPYNYNADTNEVIIHGLNPGGPSGSGGGGGGGGGGYAHLGVASAPLFHIDGSVVFLPAGGGGGGGGSVSKRRRTSDESDSGGYASLSGGGGPCETLGTDPCMHGWCTDHGMDYQCSCRLGFRQAEDKKSCIDIDECKLAGSEICLMGRCVNTPGSYTCDCQPGFHLDAGNKLCRDRNECSETPGLCAPTGSCWNLWGGYECRCNPGFVPSNSSRIECVPASRADATDFAIDGGFSVHQPECPDCMGGCRKGQPETCLCQPLETLVGGVACAPLKSRLARDGQSPNHLKLRLPAGVSPSSVTSATRRVRVTDCAVISWTVRFNVVQCRMQVA